MNKFQEVLKRGWLVKAVIFRKNMPTTVDVCKRLNDYTYKMKHAKKNLPSPPSNDFVHIIGGMSTIFLYSPRIGVYFYVDLPIVSINDTEDQLKVDYKIKRHVTIKRPVEVTQVPGQEEPVVKYELTDATKAVTESVNSGKVKKGEVISINMEMFDHDDRNFQIRDIEDTKNKYGEEKPWWKEHMASLMVFAGFLLICVGIYIVYSKTIFPSLGVLTPTINCVWDGFNNVTKAVI